MQILTSYFYQIRFMQPNYIPLSTAVWDPGWFYDYKYQGYQWKDKNGVWNGLRAEPFVPGPQCQNLCRGPEYCQTGDPYSCDFLQAYRKQLNQLDIHDIIKRIYSIGQEIKKVEQFEEEPIVVFIFHEAFTNLCSERWVVRNWFIEHGYEIKEFNFE